MVEHLLAKERVASSNLVFRSKGDVAKGIRRRSAKPLFTGSNPVIASNFLPIKEDRLSEILEFLKKAVPGGRF